MSDNLAEYVPGDEYWPTRPAVYTSRESFRWKCRNLRPELVKAGALIRPSGRDLVHPAKFDRVVMRAARRIAGHFVSKETRPTP